MIELKPGCWYLGIWHIEWPGVDWLATMWQDEQRLWHMKYRFRYDAGTDDPFDGADEKSWYSAKISDTPMEVGDPKVREAEEGVHGVAHLIAEAQGVPVEFVEIRGDYERALYKLAEQPWSHLKDARDMEK